MIDNTVTITTNAETTILQAITNTFQDLCSVIITNTSPTGTDVKLRDATGGTVRIHFYVPAGDTRGVVLLLPKLQTTAGQNWTAQCVTGVSSIEMYLQAIQRK